MQLAHDDNINVLQKRLANLQFNIDVSIDRCADLEEEIADLEGDLEAEKSYLRQLKQEHKELEHSLAKIVDDKQKEVVLLRDLMDIKRGLLYISSPYALTHDRWEIEMICGVDIPDDINFGMIEYEKFTPVNVWGGADFPHPDSVMTLLYEA